MYPRIVRDRLVIVFHPQFDTLSPSCKVGSSLDTMGSIERQSSSGLLKGGITFIWGHYHWTKDHGSLHTAETRAERKCLILHTAETKAKWEVYYTLTSIKAAAIVTEQSLSCVVLLLLTLKWQFNSLVKVKLRSLVSFWELWWVKMYTVLHIASELETLFNSNVFLLKKAISFRTWETTLNFPASVPVGTALSRSTSRFRMWLLLSENDL